MTDSVTSVASLAAPPQTTPTTPAAPPSPPVRAPEAHAEPEKPAEPQRKPLTVDVQRDQGVFVYTLRDPVTDTVLAVIPRDAVRPDRDGRHVDQRV